MRGLVKNFHLDFLATQEFFFINTLWSDSVSGRSFSLAEGYFGGLPLGLDKHDLVFMRSKELHHLEQTVNLH